MALADHFAVPVQCWRGRATQAWRLAPDVPRIMAKGISFSDLAVATVDQQLDLVRLGALCPRFNGCVAKTVRSSSPGITTAHSLPAGTT